MMVSMFVVSRLGMFSSLADITSYMRDENCDLMSAVSSLKFISSDGGPYCLTCSGAIERVIDG